MRMNDDELLRAAIEAARRDRDERARRREHDRRLDQYAEGAIGADEVAAHARANGTSERLDEELRAFRPLDDSARARIARRLVGVMTARRRPHGDDAGALAAADGGGRRARTRPARPSSLRHVTALAGALAIAAGVALFVHARGGDGSSPLPPYEVAFVGGDRAVRGGAAAPGGDHHVSRSEPFHLIARPRTAATGPVTARLFLRRGDDVRAWSAPVDVSSEGAVRVVAPLDTLPPGSDGAWDVVVAVGRPGALPEARDLASGARARDGVQLLVAHVTFDR